MKRALVAVLMAGACATAPAQGGEHSATCAAQTFLHENGYFNARIDGAVSLNESETARFVGADGSVDWAGLSAARNGQFVNRLIGATREGSGYLVVYQMDGGVRRCVDVSGDYLMTHLQEGPCQATPTYRVSEQMLRCVRLHLD